MIDRETLLKRTNNNEDRLLVSKLTDKIIKVLDTGISMHTDFLDPYQKGLAERVLDSMEGLAHTFNGGYEGAERAIAIVRPSFIPFNEPVFENSYLQAFLVTTARHEELSHRDYLGSLLGLGIKREKTGDIIITGEKCQIIVLSEIAGYIESNLLKVGNTSVSVSRISLKELDIPEKKVKEIRATVASMRLDCVVGAGYGVSRTTAAEYIKSQKLNLNWQMTDNPSKQVKEGDTVSIRGKGRIVLEKITGTTRKERISIIIKKFI